jgi:hypothetical protein
MNGVGEKLRAYWLSKGMVLPSGNSEQRIKDFEHRCRVELPTDFRDYFLHVDGMSTHWPNAQDKDGFAFWSLDCVKSVPEEAVKHKSGQEWSSFPSAESLFVFADYLDWSWAYVIRLLTAPSESGHIFIIGKQDPAIQIAESFSDFVELYLVDSPILYGT